MTTLFVVCGKVNYTNMARYSHLSERTYRRHFQQGLALEFLNQALIAQVSPSTHPRMVVVDCTFLAKSGHCTYGLDWFYNGKTQQAERGLELSVVALVDLKHNTAYTLSAQQTADGLSDQAPVQGEGDSDSQPPAKNRIDFYLGHLAYCQTYFPDDIRYVVTDGFYTKYKWVTGVTQLGLHAIGKLRCDANLKFLYCGRQKRRGRHRLFDGKVSLAELHRFEPMSIPEEPNTMLYSAIVWSVSLKRRIRLVYVLRTHQAKSTYALLFSTDLEIDPLLLYQGYCARFQIEFVFRDARQFTGLADCQARSPEAIDTHVNASLSALNLAKVAMQETLPATQPRSFSIASFKRLALNDHLLDLFIDLFALDPTLIKSHPSYQKLRDYGAIAS